MRYDLLELSNNLVFLKILVKKMPGFFFDFRRPGPFYGNGEYSR